MLLLPEVQRVFDLFSLPALKESRAKVTRPAGALPWAPLLEANFARSFELWYNDTYGMRDLLIMLRHQIEYDLFRSSKQMLVGPDNWLFDRTVIERYDVMLDSQGDKEWAVLFSRIEKLNRALADRGIKLVMIPIPWKNTIMKELVPAQVQRPAVTGWDRFMGFLRSHPEIAHVDVEADMRAAKSIAPVFYKTDLHWSAFGAEVASKSLVAKLGELSGTGTQWIHRSTIDYRKVSAGGEAAPMGLLWPPSELAPVLKHSPPEIGVSQPAEEPFGGHFKSSGKHVAAQLPKTVMVGNSFNMYFETTGLYEYFSDVYRLYDETFFTKGLSILPPDTRFVTWQLYEIEIVGQMADDRWWTWLDGAPATGPAPTKPDAPAPGSEGYVGVLKPD